MSDIAQLLENNLRWAEAMKAQDPNFFTTLKNQHTPEYLWIGCSDARVPANEIVDLLPGELFVHRNVANVVSHTDLNCLSVLQFAVDVLRVKHVLVVGHYGCAGVLAALQGRRFGLVDNWLRHVQDVRLKHAAILEQTPVDLQHDRLCELNVIEQVLHVAESNIVVDAWERGQNLTLHGWTYGIGDGRVRNLGVTVAARGEIAAVYQRALDAGGKKDS